MLRRSLVRLPRRSPSARVPSAKVSSSRVPFAGFSVLELLIVMGVIGIMAAVGVPALLSQLSKVQLEAAASNVANLMNQARQRAIKENKAHSVDVIGDEVHILRIVDDDPLVTELAFQFQFTDPGAELYTVGAVACINTPVTYESTGVADGLGQICLTDPKGNVLEVTVLSITGQPKVRKFLNAADSPTGVAGFFEKTSAATSDKAWTWY